MIRRCLLESIVQKFVYKGGEAPAVSGWICRALQVQINPTTLNKPPISDTTFNKPPISATTLNKPQISDTTLDKPQISHNT